MPTTRSIIRKKKPAVVVEEIEEIEEEDLDEELEDDEDDDEEEVAPVKRPAKKATASGATATKTAANRKPASATPAPSARSYVTAVLLAGAPREEIKKRAMAQAKKDGNVVSFKTFDVSYFIKFLEQKGYKVRENNGTVKLIAPKA